MYNMNYRYVEVGFNINDKDILEDDIAAFEHLYKADECLYKGLVPANECEDILLMMRIHPCGHLYDVKIDKLPLEDYGFYRWKVARGLV